MNAKALPANPEFRYQFDPCVFQDYAARLLPRAVGYSAGLLEYFFRGRIEIAVPDRYVYGRAAFTADNSGSFTSLRFEVPNATPNEAAGAGTLRAVVRYRTAEENLFEDPLAPVSATPAVARSTAQEVTLTDAFQELTFHFQMELIPTNAMGRGNCRSGNVGHLAPLSSSHAVSDLRERAATRSYNRFIRVATLKAPAGRLTFTVFSTGLVFAFGCVTYDASHTCSFWAFPSCTSSVILCVQMSGCGR